MQESHKREVQLFQVFLPFLQYPAVVLVFFWIWIPGRRYNDIDVKCWCPKASHVIYVVGAFTVRRIGQKSRRWVGKPCTSSILDARTNAGDNKYIDITTSELAYLIL